jgi:ketosteroid isomerase-like protein
MDDTTLAHDNKALMQQIFDGVSRGDAALFYERLADGATLHITGDYSWSQTIHGKERIARDLYGYVRSRLSQRGKTHAFHFLADGDWVVVEARGDMVTKEGQPYQNHYCMLYRLEDGRIVEIKEYQDSTLCERLLGPYPAELRSNGVSA